MNANTMLSDSLEQPWWSVRPQLVLTFCALTAICAMLWVEGPVRSWVTRAVIQTEIPQVTLLAHNNR